MFDLHVYSINMLEFMQSKYTSIFHDKLDVILSACLFSSFSITCQAHVILAACILGSCGCQSPLPHLTLLISLAEV